MAEYLNDDSKRAGEIIAFLTRTKYITMQEKAVVLKNMPYKTLVTRLLTLAFDGNIFRGLELEEHCKTQTNKLEGADERLVEFIKLHESFLAEEINIRELVDGLKGILKKLHSREFEFYQDLLKGGTCYLDYLSFKKAFLKKNELKSFVRFMQPKGANPRQAWGGKRFIVQPNYQGIQYRIILREDKKPLLIGRDQCNYAKHLKATLELAQDFLEEMGESRLEFDAILIQEDFEKRPYVDWKAKGHILVVYDYVDKKMPLKKRIKVVKRFCDYMKDEGNKKIRLMPTEILSGKSIDVQAKKYSRAIYPYSNRNGIVVKVWDSPYEYKRSANWLTFFPHKEIDNAFLGRGTLVALCPCQTRIVCMDNNGHEFEVFCSKEQSESLGRYLGYTIEYSIARDELSFRRVLYDKGREV